MQGVTGLLLMIYYAPSPDQAHTSTQFVIQQVPLGGLLQSVHHYGAYAMILLTFLHLSRGYFLSVHKKSGGTMWVLGALLGLVVLGFGFTGYLLPWTVVSKSATDVAMAIVNLLPLQIGSTLSFLTTGNGSNAAELSRFFELHVAVFPALFAALFILKNPWFSSAYLYKAFSLERIRKPSPAALRILIRGSLLLALVVAVASIFPFSLSTEFSATAATNSVPQPEWYFLWVYQIFKFASFEGNGIYWALGALIALVVVLFCIPILDRGRRQSPWSRPVYTTIGFVAIAEVLALTAWGYYTPGQVIPNSQAVLVIAVAAAVGTAFSLGLRGWRAGLGPRLPGTPLSHSETVLRNNLHGLSDTIGEEPASATGRDVVKPAAEALLSFSILALGVYMWLIDLSAMQRVFGAMAATELVLFSMVAYLHFSPKLELGVRRWLFAGCVAAALLLVFAVQLGSQ